MDPITAFFVGLGLLLGLSVATLACVQRPLNDILLEVCGAPHRARFWARLFGATLLLAVVFFCLWSPPKTGEIHELIGMLRAGLFGLLSALGLLALVMLKAQSRFQRGLASPRSGGAANPKADARGSE